MFEENNFVEPNLFGVLIHPNSIYCGISLDKIQLPENCAVLGILREGQVISGNNNSTIYAGDYILAVAIHPMMTPALKVTLKKTHSVRYSLNDCLLEIRPSATMTSNDLNTLYNSKFTHC